MIAKKAFWKFPWFINKLKLKTVIKKHALEGKFEVVWDRGLYQLEHLDFAKSKNIIDRLTKGKLHVIENKVLKMQSTHKETIWTDCKKKLFRVKYLN